MTAHRLKADNPLNVIRGRFILMKAEYLAAMSDVVIFRAERPRSLITSSLKNTLSPYY